MVSDPDLDPGPVIDDACEREYNLRPRHPERGAVYDGFARRSAAFRESCRCLLDEPYAAGTRTRLDVFPAGPGAPILVFIHGGYWRALDKAVFSFLAEPFVKAGVSVVLPNYDLAPAVTVRDIAGQIREALSWLLSNAGRYGADPSRLVLAGHSAGGHLAALTALTCTEGPIGRALRGIVPVSGLFDLAPLLRTSINRDIRLTPALALALSPLHLLHQPRDVPAPCLRLLVGGGETEGFLGQSRAFAEAWRRHGRSGELLVAPERTHFTVLEELGDPDGPVFADILTMLGHPGRSNRP